MTKMVSSESQFSQRSSNLTPRCQKRICSHRDCPRQDHSHTCPSIFWCPQCTRFWCEDCWEDVDAHQPIEVGVSGMRDHEKTIHKLLHPEGSNAEEDATKHLSMAQQEQETVTPDSNAAVTSPTPANQMERDTSKRRQTEPPRSPTPVNAQLNWALQAYEMQEKLLKQQKNKRLLMTQQEQETETPDSNATVTSPTPANQIVRSASKRRQTEPLRSPTPVNAQLNWALQTYEMQEKLLKQQKNKRLLITQQEQETVTPDSIAASTSPTPADQIEQDSSKRRQTEPPGSPTSANTQVRWALHAYEMQEMLLKQQNKKRLLAAQQEQDNMQ